MSSKKTIKALCTRPLPTSLIAFFHENAPNLQLHCHPKDASVPVEDLLNWVKKESPEALIVTLTEDCNADFIFGLPESVRILSTMAVGTDNIDSHACAQRDIRVAHTPHVLTEATADLTWALILAAGRRLQEGHVLCQNEKFQGWSPTLLLGKEFYKSRLGIVGMGRIGKAVAKRSWGFGMNVSYFNRHPVVQDEEIELLNPNYCATIEELCEKSDVISIHCPLNENSFHLFNQTVLKKCKKDAVLVNVARGPIIDENALVEVLKDGYFTGVGLDVFENEPQMDSRLFDFSRVVLSPHIGSATYETRMKMMKMAVQAVLGEKCI